ncbi:MAG: hypothetical protein HYX96_00520, partial [Chloroflexi bacterium]|nr:hypothetical protein [Chloroflexota bacterium]
MNLRQLDKTDLIDVLAGWAKRLAVYLPSAGGVSRLERWDGTSALPERYRNTAVPLKELFLPPAETMFRFHKDRSGFGLEPALPEAKASLVFGVRPCDARALSLVDKLFRDSYEDVYYLSRRQTTLLAGLACDKPYDSCFCTSLGLEP